MTADPSKSISVYAARDSRGQFRFVGRTRYFDRRATEHAARGWTIKELASVPDLPTALGLEQVVLDMARKQAMQQRPDEE